MDYRGALKEIGQGVIRPIYILYGTEQYLLYEFIQYLKRKVLEAGTEEFNYSVYDMMETPIQVAIQDAETPPFLGETRIVMVNRAYFLTGLKVTSGVEHELETLQNYLQNPMESTVLLLVSTSEKLDERKKLVKQLQEKGTVLPFLPIKDKELVSWVIRRAQKSKAQLDEQAAELMIQFIGNDLRRLGQEIEKMALFVGSEGRISEETIYQLASRTLEQDLFALIEQVTRLDLNRALRIFYDLLKNKEEPLAILSLLARQFRLMLQVKELAAKGYSQQQMASILGVHPYPVKLAMEKAKRMSEKSLRGILMYIAEEDYRIKTGGIDKVLSIELFMMRIEELMKA
ncbi:MAG TPA: DNA polymerase III subunit delta [Bacillota bacterium]|nr:DNA polymerase III subunit delta [Bacillota bacterium]